jgi:hypothetical protein
VEEKNPFQLVEQKVKSIHFGGKKRLLITKESQN